MFTYDKASLVVFWIAWATRFSLIKKDFIATNLCSKNLTDRRSNRTNLARVENLVHLSLWRHQLNSASYTTSSVSAWKQTCLWRFRHYLHWWLRLWRIVLRSNPTESWFFNFSFGLAYLSNPNLNPSTISDFPKLEKMDAEELRLRRSKLEMDGWCIILYSAQLFVSNTRNQ